MREQLRDWCREHAALETALESALATALGTALVAALVSWEMEYGLLEPTERHTGLESGERERERFPW